MLDPSEEGFHGARRTTVASTHPAERFAIERAILAVQPGLRIAVAKDFLGITSDPHNPQSLSDSSCSGLRVLLAPLEGAERLMTLGSAG